LFTAILAIATVALVVVAALQWNTLEKTDQTSRLRDRAFVYFGDPSTLLYPPDKPTVWGVGITILNSGSMPARRIRIQYDCPDALSERTDDPFLLAKWKGTEVIKVIGPKNSLQLQACQIPIDIFNASQWSKDANGVPKEPEREIFYVVQVTYLDGFSDEQRVTQASRNFRFDQQGNMSIGFLGPHNCSDNDCQIQN